MTLNYVHNHTIPYKQPHNKNIQKVITTRIKSIQIFLRNHRLASEESAAIVFNLCKTVNCMAVYGITIRNAGTLPHQNPYKKA